jgi:hypothetical protein
VLVGAARNDIARPAKKPSDSGVRPGPAVDYPWSCGLDPLFHTTDTQGLVQTMPESRLFMSSLSRRELARRRPGRSHAWRIVLLAAMVAAIIVAALLLGHGV